MRRTNLSLYYLAGYLVPAGLLLLFVPEFATKLLLSNRTYDYAPFHLAGVLLLVDRDPDRPDHSPPARAAVPDDARRPRAHQRDAAVAVPQHRRPVLRASSW